jgi:hypothetical protein
LSARLRGLHVLHFAARIFAICALTLTGCVSFYAGHYGDNVDGRSVERSINSVIGDYLHLTDPHLQVEPSRCPDRIDVSQGRAASCTLVVDNVPLSVRVVYGGPPQQFSAKLPDYFFERRSVEHFAESQILRHGVKKGVRCSGDAVSIMAPGTWFTCRIVGDISAKPFIMKVGNHGVLTFPPIAGLQPTHVDVTLSGIVRRHRSGALTLVAGSFLASYIDDFIAEAPRSSPSATPKLGLARCPTTVDLTGKKRGQCVVPLASQDIRFGIWIDELGNFQVRPIDAIISMPLVQDMAEKQLNVALSENGFSQVAKIECGRGFVVMRVPNHFYCNATIGDRPDRLLVDVKDSRGSFKFRIVSAHG